MIDNIDASVAARSAAARSEPVSDVVKPTISLPDDAGFAGDAALTTDVVREVEDVEVSLASSCCPGPVPRASLVPARLSTGAGEGDDAWIGFAGEPVDDAELTAGWFALPLGNSGDPARGVPDFANVSTTEDCIVAALVGTVVGSAATVGWATSVIDVGELAAEAGVAGEKLDVAGETLVTGWLAPVLCITPDDTGCDAGTG